MPAAGLKRRFLDVTQARSGGGTPADLVCLADLFQVSFEAMTRRLESLGLVRHHTWDRLSNAGFRVNEARRLLDLASPPPDTELLPRRFRYLAVEAWSQGDLSEGQLARLLRVDRTTARQLVTALSVGAPEVGSGDSRVSGTAAEQELHLSHT